MPCTTAKTMRFRVYTCSAIHDVNGYYLPGCDETSIHNNKNHLDTGKEFTISSPEDTLPFSKEYYGYGEDRGINNHSIATVMLQKVYGFTSRIHGYTVNWAPSKSFLEGAVSHYWYIKRVV